MKAKELDEIDSNLIEIRDALAHGRASASTDSQMRLIKFSKSQNVKVKVMFNESMTEAWFKLNKKRVFDAIHSVNKTL